MPDPSLAERVFLFFFVTHGSYFLCKLGTPQRIIVFFIYIPFVFPNCLECPLSNFSRDRSHLYCLQWANFIMGPNEQNQHLTELRQKVYIYQQKLVLLIGLQSLDVKHKLFAAK